MPLLMRLFLVYGVLFGKELRNPVIFKDIPTNNRGALN